MGFTCWLLRSRDKQVLCVSRDWLVGGSAKGSRGSHDRGVKTREDFLWRLFFSLCPSFLFNVLYWRSFWKGGAWVSSSQSSPVEMQACTFHHRVIVGWGQSTLGSQTQSSNRTQGSPCTSLEKHSECTVWLNQSIIISPNTFLVSFFRILYNPLSLFFIIICIWSLTWKPWSTQFAFDLVWTNLCLEDKWCYLFWL